MARSGGDGTRHLVVRVKTARRRKPSSNEWLARQLNDPFVAEARRLGYRPIERVAAFPIDGD